MSFVDVSNLRKKERSCFDIANHVVTLCKLDVPKITTLQDFHSQFFVDLFEKVFDVPVPDVIAQPLSIEDEVHNIQCVIDTMALSILNISLPHITAEDIMAKNMTSIANLMEVFEGYLLLCLPEIAAGLSTSSQDEKPKKNDEGSICNFCGFQYPSILNKRPHMLDKADLLMFKYGDAAICPCCNRSQLLSSSFGKGSSSSSDDLGNKPPKSFSSQTNTSKTSVFPNDFPIGGAHPSTDETDLPQPCSSKQTDYTSTKPKVIFESSGSYEAAEIVSPPQIISDQEVESDQSKPKVTPFNGSSDHEFVHLKENIPQTFETYPPVLIEPKSRKKKRRKCQKDEVSNLYGENFVSRIRNFLQDETHYGRESVRLNKIYLNSMKKTFRKPVKPICRKSYLLPYQLRVRPRYKQMPPFRADEGNFIWEIQHEIPGVEIPLENIHRMEQQYQQHLNTTHKRVCSTLKEKSQVEVQAEEALKRQKILADIFERETIHKQQANERQAHKQQERELRATRRDTRMESAKLKQMHDDYIADMRKRMVRTKYGEDKLVKKVFDERLKMEKEQVIVLRQQLKEKQQNEAERHKIYLESLENFYETQFELLADSIAAEKKDMGERTIAQQRALERTKREYRAQMEHEVKKMKEQIDESHDMHFKELDAERFIDKLRDRYSTRQNN